MNLSIDNRADSDKCAYKSPKEIWQIYTMEQISTGSNHLTAAKSWIPYLIIWNQNSSDKYVPGRTKVKEDEGPRKGVMFIPMGGQNKKY